jgi:hypothetical protein
MQMPVPLAIYLYWTDVLFSPIVKAARAAEIANDQMKSTGRRLPYISARIYNARQNAD